MVEFFNEVGSTLLHFSFDPKYEFAISVFAVCCAFFGVVAVVLDFLIYKVNGGSLLDLKYDRNSTTYILLLWTFGALIVGYISQLVYIFQLTVLSCLIVGFSWPYIATKILKKIKDIDASDDPEQKI